MLEQKAYRRRFSKFLRSLKRNSSVSCKEITTVAVKLLKGNWNRTTLLDLHSELKILIHIGEHENIINILGACTKGESSDLWIIMEYCQNGDLKSFLRSSRDIYDVEETSLASDPSQVLCPRQVALFALQISQGMEFLISRKIIHRDLAARNVLLANKYMAKISDFGLARNVYRWDQYVKKSSGLVPLKWMAIESIKDATFTEKSDVWSFGVLLWELFTLGGTPYPGIQAMDLYKHLLNGERMNPPIYCPAKISQMMASCWIADPNNRPNFRSLVDDLKKCIEDALNFEVCLDNQMENETVKQEFNEQAP